RYSESLRHPERTRHFLKRRYGLEQANYLPLYVDETGFAPTTYSPYPWRRQAKRLLATGQPSRDHGLAYWAHIIKSAVGWGEA
ncbi:MAG: hypothetical protein FWG81_04285, partial [Betaproteobacteria bacterium]|nr:hypothetical protein [Betaproteobacteria bacterium]